MIYIDAFEVEPADDKPCEFCEKILRTSLYNLGPLTVRTCRWCERVPEHKRDEYRARIIKAEEAEHDACDK